jgi:hypothetical protein
MGGRISTPGTGDKYFSTVFRPALRPTQPPIQWVPRGFSLRLKIPWREADHSLPSTTDVNNDETIPSFPIRVHGIVLSETEGQNKLLLSRKRAEWAILVSHTQIRHPFR